VSSGVLPHRPTRRRPETSVRRNTTLIGDDDYQRLHDDKAMKCWLLLKSHRSFVQLINFSIWA